MRKREITGQINRIDGKPWVGGEVLFNLEPSSYTSTEHVISQMVKGVVNPEGELKAADGESSLELWCNADGLIPSRYECTMPDGETFPFRLNAGEGPISLEALRESGLSPAAPGSPAYAVLESFIRALRLTDLADTPDTTVAQANKALVVLADGTFGLRRVVFEDPYGYQLDFSKAANSGQLSTIF